MNLLPAAIAPRTAPVTIIASGPVICLPAVSSDLSRSVCCDRQSDSRPSLPVDGCKPQLADPRPAARRTARRRVSRSGTAGSTPVARKPRKQAEPVVLPGKPANWAQMSQRERTAWYSAQCHAITTTDDKRWAKLVESIQDKWPNNLTPDELQRQIDVLDLHALAGIAFGW